MKETVKALAEQVAEGAMEPAEAGAKMRPLLAKLILAKTEAQKKAGYNEAALETDPNSFVHVNALYYLGELTEEQYNAIHAAVVG